MAPASRIFSLARRRYADGVRCRSLASDPARAAGTARRPRGRRERFLLKHGFRAGEMRRSLSQAGGSSIGEAALLAMEYDPGQALPLFRRALRSDVPANRGEAAAVLALVDRPWSRRELRAVL